jgi:hypothetical protein
MSSRRFRGVALALAIAGFGVQTSARAVSQDRPERSARSYLGTLRDARVSQTPDGRIVITLDAEGDLRGHITLNLTAREDGKLAGTWAFVVAYLQDLTPDGRIAIPTPPPLEEHESHAEHREYAKFVREGTIQGTVADVALRIGADGNPQGLELADLVVLNGSMTLAGAAGSGRLAFVAGETPKTTFILTF